MADDKKTAAPASNDKNDKVADLPTQDASKADQVKGGRMPLKPKL